MRKLIYPSEGIYTYCKSDLSNSLSNLRSAISYTNYFSIPTDFTYRSYLYGLGSTLVKYQNEAGSIDSVLSTTDNDYESLSERLSFEANKLTSTKVKDRERMIK